ncbi:GNAT family N-acetyltransferase [Pantoea ananatis]|uniref:GNAT family N-acetyltransferase n=1 Tax=Pantoea ananas TaxID=553 RepID=UPI000D72B600|nr:N-acetyltransferase [Pantoea ananatis]AWQ20227.1 GNAT family N-acetyltransferase [Pantoea ananatis]
MLIRTEIGVDAAGIDALLRRCFPTSAEAELTQALREDGLLTLGVVATDDEGQVLGYAAFSPVTMQGEDRNWVGLAPLAVDESLRGQGIAKQLVYEGLDTLNEFGYSAVVVLGDPALYNHLGFEPAARHGLHCSWPDNEAAFQVYPLADNAFDGAEGRIEYSAPFNKLS